MHLTNPTKALNDFIQLEIGKSMILPLSYNEIIFNQKNRITQEEKCFRELYLFLQKMHENKLNVLGGLSLTKKMCKHLLQTELKLKRTSDLHWELSLRLPDIFIGLNNEGKNNYLPKMILAYLKAFTKLNGYHSCEDTTYIHVANIHIRKDEFGIEIKQIQFDWNNQMNNILILKKHYGTHGIVHQCLSPLLFNGNQEKDLEKMLNFLKNNGISNNDLFDTITKMVNSQSFNLKYDKYVETYQNRYNAWSELVHKHNVVSEKNFNQYNLPKEPIFEKEGNVSFFQYKDDIFNFFMNNINLHDRKTTDFLLRLMNMKRNSEEHWVNNHSDYLLGSSRVLTIKFKENKLMVELPMDFIYVYENATRPSNDIMKAIFYWNENRLQNGHNFDYEFKTAKFVFQFTTQGLQLEYSDIDLNMDYSITDEVLLEQIEPQNLKNIKAFM